MIRDLTEGRPFRVLLLFSLPMFFSMLFQQIYNLADSLIAGRFISEAALGAVGTCYPVTVIFIAIASGLSLGANTAAARAFGGKDWKELRQMIPTALLFMLLLSAAVMAAGLFACGPLLDLLQIPSDLREMCEVYLRIYLFGLPFLFLYNMAGSLFQALGDSRTPWRFLAAASVINVLLDLLFAAVLKMGIPGTAWGTFLAQGFSAAGSCAALLRTFRRRILPEGAGRLVRWKYAGIILKLGIPSVLQQVFISLGQLSLQSVINPYGSGAGAGRRRSCPADLRGNHPSHSCGLPSVPGTPDPPFCDGGRQPGNAGNRDAVPDGCGPVFPGLLPEEYHGRSSAGYGSHEVLYGRYLCGYSGAHFPGSPLLCPVRPWRGILGLACGLVCGHGPVGALLFLAGKEDKRFPVTP